MNLDTHTGEDERDIRVDFDYQPPERATNTEQSITINQVWCIEHERQTGLRADEVLSDDDLERITMLCWEMIVDAKAVAL